MPGSTPELAIPYALPTDQLAEWPSLNQSTSERIEELFNSNTGSSPAGDLTPDVLRRVAYASSAVSGTSTANGQIVITATIPNPVNGRRYRAYVEYGIVPTIDGMYVRHQLGFGKGVTESTATWFAGMYTDHRINNRNVGITYLGEFTYTGTTGDTGFQVLACMFPEATKPASPYGQQDRPIVLVVDELIATGGTAVITQAPVPTVHGAWQLNTAQSLTTAVVTTIAYDTVVTPPVGGLTMTAGVIKVPVAGSYLVTAAVCFNTNTTGSRFVYVYKNGSYLVRVQLDQNETGPTGTVSKLVDCAANDTIEIKAYQNSGAALTLLNTNQATVADIVLVDVPAGTGVAGIATGGSIMGDGSNGNTIRPGYTVEIPTAADLNTYTLPGQYSQTNSGEAAAGTNYPTPPIAGLLEVFANGSNMIWQRYTNYAGNTPGGGYVWERGLYNSVWSAWQIVGGNVDLPDPIDTYIGTDQTITTTTGGTETPTAVRASMVNPHPTKRLLVRVDVQARGITTGTSGGACAYFGAKPISGGSNAVPAFEFAADASFVQANMIGYVYSWIAAAGTGVYGMYCSKGSTAFTLLIRYCHTSIIPIRYE
jgi:hypothetical protein